MTTLAAAPTLFAGIERQELRERAAFLERAGAMQRLELEMDFSVSEFGQRRRRNYRSVCNRALDRCCGAPDLIDGYR